MHVTDLNARLDYTQDITVLVGETEQRFTLHKGIVTQHSAFFRAACNGKFKESIEETVRLPEVDVAIFKIYVQWIYTGEIVVIDPEELTDHESKNAPTRYLRLTQLYVLADRLEDVHLRNAVVDTFLKLVDETRKCPSIRAIEKAYEQTAGGSMLRILFSDYYVQLDCAEWFKECREDLPQDFIFDVLVQSKQCSKIEPAWEDRCRYHEHNGKVPKCA